MKLYILALLMFLVNAAFSQNRVLFEFDRVVHKSDSINFEKIQSIEINADPVSPIVPFAAINGKELAIKVEVLKSQLDRGENYVAGYVFYVREAGQPWEQVVSSNHQRIYPENRSSADKRKNNSLGSHSSTTNDEKIFELRYKLTYFWN